MIGLPCAVRKPANTWHRTRGPSSGNSFLKRALVRLSKNQEGSLMSCD
jgi:hypothetical protein